MESVTLEELKIFESSIKEKIFNSYSTFISQDKINNVLKKEYVTYNIFNKKKSLAKLHGEIIRKIFSDLINKNVKLDDEDNLHQGLVEYYTENIANEYEIEINERPDLKGQIKNILNKQIQLGYKLDDIAFSDEKIINNNKNKCQVSLIYVAGEQYVKLVDEDGNISIAKSDNQEEISNIFKKLAKDNLDAETMYNRFIAYIKEQKGEKEEKEKNSEIINILDFISDENTDNQIEDIPVSETKTTEEEPIVENQYSQEAYEKLIKENLNREEELFKDTTKQIVDEKEKKLDTQMILYILSIIVSIILIIMLLYLKFFTK